MRSIEGYDGFYSVTECGKVFSHRRDRYMKPGLGGGGRYRMVTLTIEGTPKGFMVHRLVAIAYIENPLNKPEVNHIDANRYNNHVSNLEWVTRQENVDHAVKLGLYNLQDPKTLFQKGYDPRRGATTTLKDNDVIEMRKRRSNGETYTDISKDYPVNESTIRRACKGESFSYII